MSRRLALDNIGVPATELSRESHAYRTDLPVRTGNQISRIKATNVP